MKYKFIFLALAILVVMSFCNYCFADYDEDKRNVKLLSSNEIDLLVGTPDGVGEPLDYRRNKITKENQVDYSSFFDDDALENTNVNIEWEDAEEKEPNEYQVENQFSELFDETEELENLNEIYYNDEEYETASDTKEITINKIKQSYKKSL